MAHSPPVLPSNPEGRREVKLECGVDGCKLPFGHLHDGVLVIECKHHGERHINAITLEKLLHLMKEGAPQEGAWIET